MINFDRAPQFVKLLKNVADNPGKPKSFYTKSSQFTRDKIADNKRLNRLIEESYLENRGSSQASALFIAEKGAQILDELQEKQSE